MGNNPSSGDTDVYTYHEEVLKVGAQAAGSCSSDESESEDEMHQDIISEATPLSISNVALVDDKEQETSTSQDVEQLNSDTDRDSSKGTNLSSSSSLSIPIDDRETAAPQSNADDTTPCSSTSEIKEASSENTVTDESSKGQSVDEDQDDTGTEDVLFVTPPSSRESSPPRRSSRILEKTTPFSSVSTTPKSKRPRLSMRDSDDSDQEQTNSSMSFNLKMKRTTQNKEPTIMEETSPAISSSSNEKEADFSEQGSSIKHNLRSSGGSDRPFLKAKRNIQVFKKNAIHLRNVINNSKDLEPQRSFSEINSTRDIPQNLGTTESNIPNDANEAHIDTNISNVSNQLQCSKTLELSPVQTSQVIDSVLIAKSNSSEEPMQGVIESDVQSAINSNQICATQHKDTPTPDIVSGSSESLIGSLVQVAQPIEITPPSTAPLTIPNEITNVPSSSSSILKSSDKQITESSNPLSSIGSSLPDDQMTTRETSETSFPNSVPNHQQSKEVIPSRQVSSVQPSSSTQTASTSMNFDPKQIQRKEIVPSRQNSSVQPSTSTQTASTSTNSNPKQMQIKGIVPSRQSSLVQLSTSTSSQNVQDIKSIASSSSVAAPVRSPYSSGSDQCIFTLSPDFDMLVLLGDITKQNTTAIVNSTDGQLHHHGGLSSSVASAASQQMIMECRLHLQRSGSLGVNQPMDTCAGGRLNPRIEHIIHIVPPMGPGNQNFGGDKATVDKLINTYLSCLKHADRKLHCSSIAFPLLGSGSFPPDASINCFYNAVLIFLSDKRPQSQLTDIRLIINDNDIHKFAVDYLCSCYENILSHGIDSSVADALNDFYGNHTWQTRQSTTFVSYTSPVKSESGRDSTTHMSQNLFRGPAIKRPRL